MEEGHTLELQMREIALLIDGFAKEADEIVEIGEKLKGVKEQDFRLDIFRQPFYYDIALKNDDGRGEKYDTFVPIVEGDGYCFPPLVENIPESHLNLYKDILPFLIERIPIAIYSDILWVRHVENGDKFARRAIEAYSVASENDRHQIRGTRLLGRALEISKEINDKKLMESLLEKNRDHLVDTMKLSDAVDRPGVVLRYIDNILEAPASYWDSLGLIKILDDVSVIYDGNAYIMQVILEHKARVKPEKKVLFYEEIVKIYLEEARSATSTIQKNKFLLDALEAAKKGNLKDWIIDLEVKLYETKDEPKDWNVIEKEIPIPTELIEKLFNTVLIHDSLETASLAFGSIVPVQDIDSIAAFVADLRRDHPLQFLVSRQIYDANNVLIKECLTDEDLYTLALVDQDKLAISIYGALFPELLRRLNNKFSMQSPEQLDKLFTNTLLGLKEVDSLKEAVQNYFDREYYSAAMYLIPAIESIFRGIVHMLGLSVYQAPRGIHPGRVLSLGNLLSKLKTRTPAEKTVRYYETVLTNPYGLNLRNDLCHGLKFDVSEVECSILIHLAFSLCLVKLENL